MTFGEAGSVEAENQRHVGEAGWSRAERLVEQHLPRRIRQMVVAADDVRDPHLGVVDDAAEDEEWRAVRADDDEIVEVGVLEHDAALHLVVHDRLALERRAEAQHGRGPAGRGGRAVAAGPVVGGPLPGGLRGAPARVELLGSAPAAVGEAPDEERFGFRAVPVEARALVDRPLVPVEAEPAEPVEDRVDRLGGGAFRIGILDAKDEASAVMSREEVVEERGPRPADVQIAAGARREARTNGHRGDVIGRPETSQRIDTASDSFRASLRLPRHARILAGRER